MTDEMTELETAIEASGFKVLGRLAAEAPFDGGHLVLIGNAGPAMWDAFVREREGLGETLDRWSNRSLNRIAGDAGGTCLFPNLGPPWHPFQQWGLETGHISSSPLGIQVHDVYGLWFAYRGALHLQTALPDVQSGEPSPCESCADKPCRTACPVGAIGQGNYDVPRCTAHISSEAGKDCLALGCRARRACPVGQEFTYVPAQAEFHMQAFLTANS